MFPANNPRGPFGINPDIALKLASRESLAAGIGAQQIEQGFYR
ncbi:hypothetical protein [Mesorhizobium sp. SARCC-RB16n]|nr:hypothetical protein [Mesorhizobium sp. SARCC-RB16n]